MQEHHTTYREADGALRAAGYRYDLIGGMWRHPRGKTATIRRAQRSSAEPPAYVVSYCPATDLVARQAQAAGR
jgi:ribosomal protein L32E